MTMISIPHDVDAPLPAPKAGADPMTQLRIQAGLFGLADGICQALTGFSPLKEWVFKPVAGDWTALDKGADAWRNAGKAAKELASAADGLPGQVGDAWSGATALSWAQANGKAVQLFQQLPDRAEQMASMCDAISQAAQAIASLIADILGQLSESLIQAAVEAAIPVVGWGAEAETAAQIAGEITEFGTNIAERITQFVALLRRLEPILEELLGVGEEIETFATKLAQYAPKVLEMTETLAAAAPEIKQVATAVTTAKEVSEKVDHVIEYTKEGAEVIEKSSEAYTSTVDAQ